jgi:hypothetical protein
LVVTLLFTPRRSGRKQKKYINKTMTDNSLTYLSTRTDLTKYLIDFMMKIFLKIKWTTIRFLPIVETLLTDGR